jgi:hypothetical protein
LPKEQENGKGGSGDLVNDKRVHPKRPTLHRRTSTWSILGKHAGYNIGGVIIPTCIPRFKSPMIETLYREYYSQHYGNGVILLNVIAILVNIVFWSLCLATEEVREIRTCYTVSFAMCFIAWIIICWLTWIKKFKSKRKTDVMSFLTWFLLTFQPMLESILDFIYSKHYTVLFHYMCQMLYAV